MIKVTADKCLPKAARSRPMLYRVVSLEDVTPKLRVVRLGMVGRAPFRFAAGQYAKLAFGDQRPRDFSIASRPDEPELEFHVRHSNGGGASAYIARHLRVGDGVWVEGPYGDAWLRADHSGPILAIAGGSGLAPVKSIVETALLAGRHADISLYFGARDCRDLYLDRHFRRLVQRHKNFRYIPVLSEPRAPTTCRVGMVTDAVAADLCSCTGLKAYIAGPPAMIGAAIGLLSSLGIERADIHTDLLPVVVSSASERPVSLAPHREAICPAAASVSSGT